MNKNRLIYDLCTPTRERRYTTADDIREDIHVEDYDSPEELYDELLDLADVSKEEYESDPEIVESSTDDKIVNLLEYLNEDPGDGSPNILFAMTEGVAFETMPYYGIEELDLENITEEELIDELIDRAREEGDLEEEESKFDDDWE